MTPPPSRNPWERAATRALAAGLPSLLRRRGNTVLVPSKSESGRVYHVQLAGGRVGACTCLASLSGKPCAHRAAVVVRLWEREAGVHVTAVKPGSGQAMARYLR